VPTEGECDAPEDGVVVAAGATVGDDVGAVTEWPPSAADDLPGSVSATAMDRAPADMRAPAAVHLVTRDTRRSPSSRSNSLFMPPFWSGSDKKPLRHR
jgi:hypothetical protein